MKVRVSIAGGSGYVGWGAVAIAPAHPGVEIGQVTPSGMPGEPV